MEPSNHQQNGNDLDAILHKLMHYLPAQAPLKDFVHHNTLHAFQPLPFHEAMHQAHSILGYKTYLSLRNFRDLFANGDIKEGQLDSAIISRKGASNLSAWKAKTLRNAYNENTTGRVGQMRNQWKRLLNKDIDSIVYPVLFRLLSHYLDQGISIWDFPSKEKGLLVALRQMESNTSASIFRTKAAKALLLDTNLTLEDMLLKIVGDPKMYETYLFDMQFAHPGWSGMVAHISENPGSLLEEKKISFSNFLLLELILEWDALTATMEDRWKPVASMMSEKVVRPFDPIAYSEYAEVLSIWQEANEWTLYDQVLSGIQQLEDTQQAKTTPDFQAFFCIDDRECSLRRYIEDLHPNCETLGTPGFFGVDAFYQPAGGAHLTKICPVPVSPRHLIKETEKFTHIEKDVHFSKHTHSFHSGWLISQTLGFFSAVKLFANIFRPSMSPATASSLKHHHKEADLTIEHQQGSAQERNLQVGYTIDEMVARVEGVLRTTGLLDHFAPLIYPIGHGASTINNPHYAAYDCGACCGRAGSVNARSFSYMCNHPEVRKLLGEKGIHIPDGTWFVGGLHDTTRDEIVFFDEDKIPANLQAVHQQYRKIFDQALDKNAWERSRRFESINTVLSPAKIHQKILRRSVSLFEPRPELNHATNAMCIVGRRSLTRGLFLDRRAFMNSYDCTTDPSGDMMFNILKAAGPVCGGINLEYYFSRVDNQKLGAGTKLPHNVIGLIGVANGIDGDLRPGLPSQMIEVHDPLRLMMVVEHYPEVVLQVVQRVPALYEWFKNEWVILVAVHPETKQTYRLKDDGMVLHVPMDQKVPRIKDISTLINKHMGNLPVHILEA